MIKKLKSILEKISSMIFIAGVILLWQIVCATNVVPKFMLPAPNDVVSAFLGDFNVLLLSLRTTLLEAFYGLLSALVFSFIISFLMDRFNLFYKTTYPILIITQTIPTVAIAPLLVLWLGYDMLPKIVLVAIVCFFPITVALLEGLKSTDEQMIKLMQSMGASKLQIFRFAKLPSSLMSLFSGLKIAVSYSIVGAVIAEWLGGYDGLGVYMTRVKKSYAFDKMFAVIFLISIISLILIKLLGIVQKRIMPWNNIKNKDKVIYLKKFIAFISIFLTIGLCFTFSSCSITQKSDHHKKIDFVLDWTPNTNHTGIYVAKQLGYFDEEGINININQPPEDGATSIVASGKAQFGIDFQDSLAMAFSLDTPMPVTAVAAVLQHNTSGIISLKDKNIKTPKDMENKKYSCWNGPLELPMIKYMVEKDGGNYDNIKIVPNTVSDVITGLNSDIDAMWIYYNWDGIATEVKGISTNFFEFKDISPVFDYYTPVIIANNEFLNNDPETSAKVLKAIKKGYEYTISNPESAANILLEAVPELDKDITLKSQLWLANKYKADSLKWGYIDSERWNRFYSWLYENAIIENKIEDDFGFSNKYLD